MDDAEARAILREHGEQPPKRGQLGHSWRARADELAASNGAEPGDDYGQGVSPADFVSTAADPPEPGAAELPDRPRPRPPGRPEQPPRRRQRKPRRGLADRLRDAAAPKPGKPRKHHPRLSTAPLIGELWAGMGSLTINWSAPVGRTFIMQSPVAGDVLDDTVKGTALDPALQWAARVEDKAKTVGALVLPPVIITMLEQAETLPEPARTQRLRFLEPLAIRSFMLWDRVSADKMEQAIERAQLEKPRMEQAIRLLAMIRGETVPEPAEPEPARA
jgi:hypothetical protein